MPRDPRAWLSDIVTACDLIVEFTVRRTFQDYLTDALLRSGVERQLEIIGEALRVAVRHRPGFEAHITDVAAIIAFRNQLTHAYSAIDDARCGASSNGEFLSCVRRSPVLSSFSTPVRRGTRSGRPAASDRTTPVPIAVKAATIGRCIRGQAHADGPSV